MQVVTIIVIVILCLVAALVVGVVVYIAAKRYYFDYIRRKMRFNRLENLAMFIPAASAKIGRLKKQVKHGAPEQVQKHDNQNSMVRGRRRQSSESFDEVLQIHEPAGGERTEAESHK